MVVTETPLPEALPKPFDEAPNPAGILPGSPTQRLVRGQVRSLLASAPSYHELSGSDQASLEHHMAKIAAYAAECVRDDWAQSEKLGQRPVRVNRETARTLAAGDEFQPAAADQIARVTRATLDAIAFPEFVADLINGSYNAIVNSSIQQMEAYTELLENVSKTVDQFMADNITDNQARDWLAQRYPAQIRVAEGEPRLEAPDGADEAERPAWRESLGLPEDVDPGDEDAYEEILVPAARRKLAQSRLQTLSTLVLMGLQRIIVTGGKIRATMAFHVDTTDRAAQQRASDFDFRSSVAGSAGFGPWSASASVSVGYVRSDRSQSESELNVEADLTGEVEIHFRSDVVPLERFASEGQAETIRSNTAVPEQNPPPWGASAPIRAGRSERQAMETFRPIGQMPEPRPAPVAPTPVTGPAPQPAAGGPANRAPASPPATSTPSPPRTSTPAPAPTTPSSPGASTPAPPTNPTSPSTPTTPSAPTTPDGEGDEEQGTPAVPPPSHQSAESGRDSP